MCQLCLHPLVLAFMSHLLCWGRSQGQNHLFKTHTRASLSLVHWQQDSAHSWGGQRLFFKVKLPSRDNRRVCERHTTKTCLQMIYRLLGASHIFMTASIRAKVKKCNPEVLNRHIFQVNAALWQGVRMVKEWWWKINNILLTSVHIIALWHGILFILPLCEKTVSSLVIAGSLWNLWRSRCQGITQNIIHHKTKYWHVAFKVDLSCLRVW